MFLNTFDDKQKQCPNITHSPFLADPKDIEIEMVYKSDYAITTIFKIIIIINKQ